MGSVYIRYDHFSLLRGRAIIGQYNPGPYIAILPMRHNIAILPLLLQCNSGDLLLSKSPDFFIAISDCPADLLTESHFLATTILVPTLP